MTDDEIQKECRRQYFRNYYKKNKDKYRMINGKRVGNPNPKRKVRKKKEEEQQFSIKRGEFVVVFQ
jgi:mRNA-degrading endonuclease RelE of RelBE toxin-antitoxin system